MSSPPNAVEVEGLSKHFGSASALGGLSFSVASGEFLTIFGPNGAGKTTLMRILATLARPSAGSVYVFGQDAGFAPAQIRRRIGLVSHSSLLYAALSAYQNVVFYARMFGLANPEERSREVLTELGLEHRMDDPVQTYSRGMEQRCAIARALVHRPEILLLDEPFSGLDPEAVGRLTELLRRPEDTDRTVILTSHDLSRGADLADRVAVLARGRLVFDAPVNEIPGDDMVAVYRQHTGARVA